MARKTVLVLVALALIAMGSAMTYLALSVPNDIRAEAMLREARDELNSKQRDAARDRLRTVLEQYPRTDAAATAINILFRMEEQERAKLLAEIEELRTLRERDLKRVAQLAGDLTETSKQTVAAATEAAAAKKLAEQKPKIIVQKPAPTPRRTTRRR
jgi:hypothetical protein